MANTPEETARRLEQQAQVQKEQFDMIRAQQESIDTLKQMLAQFLEDKKSKAKTSSKKSKDKQKEGESSSSVHIEEEKQSNSESSKSSSKEEGDLENGGIHSKRMKLE